MACEIVPPETSTPRRRARPGWRYVIGRRGVNVLWWYTAVSETRQRVVDDDGIQLPSKRRLPSQNLQGVGSWTRQAHAVE